MLYSERGRPTAPVSVQPAANDIRPGPNRLRKSDRSRDRERERSQSRNRGSNRTRQVLVEMLHVSSDDYGLQTTQSTSLYVSFILHSRILLMYGVVLIIIMVCLLKQAFSIREFHSTFSYLL